MSFTQRVVNIHAGKASTDNVVNIKKQGQVIKHKSMVSWMPDQCPGITLNTLGLM